MIKAVSLKFRIINENDKYKFKFNIWKTCLLWFKIKKGKMANSFEKKNFLIKHPETGEDKMKFSAAIDRLY